MKTAEELFRDYHTQTSYSLVMYEQNFIEALTEHDAEIKALIEPIEGRVAKLLDDSSFTFGVEPRITLIKIDRALTDLKEKL